jgi:DNA-directed RNA polymerase specialized sigma24 family protein
MKKQSKKALEKKEPETIKPKRIRTPAKKEHYVNNKEFLQGMIEYLDKCDKLKKRGRKPLPVTNYLGECFLKIANHLSYRPNFINYTFRDDMISDGIENCLQYLRNFNPKKSNNPFAYFTQIIYYAFVRRIQKEKKQTIIKQKIIMDANYDDMTLQPGEDRVFKNQFTEFLQKNIPTEETYNKIVKKTAKKTAKATKKRVRKAKANLEDFII